MDSGLEIAGRYRLEQVLGGGTFGQVWRAVDSLRDRPVAVKVLHRDVATSDPVWLTKFRQEARIAVRLSHRNIAAVDDFGEYNGQWYLVMEFLDGVNLDQKIVKNPKGLALPRVLAMATQIAEGLVAAHEYGIVHRDLKPANIMLLDGDQIKICDFGMAHISDASATSTLSGQAAGTPTFMAPEQWLGNAVDPRTDLYAFGGILYVMLTGRPPFPGQSVSALMGQHLNMTPAAPSTTRPEIPEVVDQLVLDLLAKEPGQRPGHTSEVLARLHHIAGSHASSSDAQATLHLPCTERNATKKQPASPSPYGPEGRLVSHDEPTGRRLRQRHWYTLLAATLTVVMAAAISMLAILIDHTEKNDGPEMSISGHLASKSPQLVTGGTETRERPTSKISDDADGILEFGASHTYPDGLRISVGKPKRFTPDSTFFGPREKSYVSFTVTITNDTSKRYEPTGLTVTLQSVNKEMEQVFDPRNHFSGIPFTSLLPGRKVVFKVGFGAIDPGDMVLQVHANPDRDKLIFAS